MSTPDERSAALLAQLDARGVALSMQVMAEIYADPFWRARFGDRGRRHADQDSDFHIQHLREALAARDARVMTRYARWLQSVLTTRGMCSLHLADNFARLAVVLSRELEGGAEVQVYLQSASAALTYESGPARAVQLAADTLAKGPIERELVSYLADAIALGRPRAFVDHAAWRAQTLGPIGGELAALTAKVQAHAALSADARTQALALLGAATGAILAVVQGRAP